MCRIGCCLKCCCFIGRPAALGIVDHLRRRFARFELRAYLLQARSKRFNLLLLPSDDRFQVLHLMMLFEELVEQHRVHRFVAHGVNLPSRRARLDRDSPSLLPRQSSQTAGCHRVKLLLVAEGTGLSARIASLALSIGLMLSLKRAEEADRAELTVADLRSTVRTSVTADSTRCQR